ncbi:MAG: hypothetical protein E6J85_10230 [Deltaproteobacteria bacterium]|nr:MAG: hypothetical protein E6J85_10230 [Deltaproteobacteria bacterium]TMB28671.1 MAG: hypothetical protein E6J61_17380 [Deltaproteobacteria bacterium]
MAERTSLERPGTMGAGRRRGTDSRRSSCRAWDRLGRQAATMNAEVVFTDDFRSDLRAQTRRLIAEEKRDWAERLIEEIELAARLLGAAPRAGAVERQRGRRSIRRLVLRNLPFVIWYAWMARSRKVVVLRLFHARQQR